MSMDHMNARDHALQGHHHGYDNVGWEDVHIQPSDRTHRAAETGFDMCGSDPFSSTGFSPVGVRGLKPLDS